MPDPQTLKVGDLVRFISLPEEWSTPGYPLQRECIAFMKKMINRATPSRVAWIDEYGQPWIEARLRQRGRIDQHTWAIMESTGWRLVNRRPRKKARKAKS